MAKFEIDLNLPDVKIINMETTKAKDLVITVKSTQKSTICHNCGQKITKYMAMEMRLCCDTSLF